MSPRVVSILDRRPVLPIVEAHEEGTIDWAASLKESAQVLLKSHSEGAAAQERTAASLTERLGLLRDRAWKILPQPNGEPFRSFEDFCEQREPYGLGTTMAIVRQHLVDAIGERATQIAVVPPAEERKRDERGRLTPSPRSAERTQVDRTDNTSSAERTSFSTPGHSQERAHRAIAERAPQAIRDLFSAGHIGVKQAALFGTTNVGRKARMDLMVEDVMSVAKSMPGSAARDVQRVVNAKVADLLDPAPPVVEVAGANPSALRSSRKLYDLTITPQWRTKQDEHSRIKSMLAEGMTSGEIIEATGLPEQFVRTSIGQYRVKDKTRPRVMASAIDATTDVADTWEAWADSIKEESTRARWPNASREEKEELIRAVEACMKTGKELIRELKKEARKGSTS